MTAIVGKDLPETKCGVKRRRNHCLFASCCSAFTGKNIRNKTWDLAVITIRLHTIFHSKLLFLLAPDLHLGRDALHVHVQLASLCSELISHLNCRQWLCCLLGNCKEERCGEIHLCKAVELPYSCYSSLSPEVYSVALAHAAHAHGWGEVQKDLGSNRFSLAFSYSNYSLMCSGSMQRYIVPYGGNWNCTMHLQNFPFYL